MRWQKGFMVATLGLITLWIAWRAKWLTLDERLTEWIQVMLATLG